MQEIVPFSFSWEIVGCDAKALYCTDPSSHISFFWCVWICDPSGELSNTVLHSAGVTSQGVSSSKDSFLLKHVLVATPFRRKSHKPVFSATHYNDKKVTLLSKCYGHVFELVQSNVLYRPLTWRFPVRCLHQDCGCRMRVWRSTSVSTWVLQPQIFTR